MKQFLLITYYYPPCGGVSVQRWLNLSRTLLQHNWQATVLTTQDGDYPNIDETLLNKIPPEIEVIRVKTPKYGQLLRLFTGKGTKLPYGSLQTTKNDPLLKRLIFWLRLQFISPDMRVLWNKNALKAAETLIKSNKYEVIVTTGPPHSTHLIGARLKKRHNIAWITDFRDPWVNMYYYQNVRRNPAIKYIDRVHENNVLQSADSVITVSHGYKELLTSKARVIPNAFDTDDFADTAYTPTDTFRITLGGASNTSRNSEILQALTSINAWAVEKELDSIAFTLIGADSSLNPVEMGITKIACRCLPFTNHNKVIAECVNSEVLFLPINQAKYNAGNLTLKLYEYIGSGAFIMALGPSDSEVRGVLENLQGRGFFEYHQMPAFLDLLSEIYNKWQAGEIIRNNEGRQKFSIQATSKLYAQELDITAQKGRGQC